MKIRLRISLIVAIIAAVGLLTLQYIWIHNLYLSEQKRIQAIAFSELDVTLTGELISSSLEWQKQYFAKGKKPPLAGMSYDYNSLKIIVFREGLPNIERECKTKEEFLLFQRGDGSRYHVCGMNLSRLDSAYAKHLAKYDIKLPYVIEKIDCATQKPIGRLSVGRSARITGS